MKKKLKLSSLAVKSFVTKVEESKEETVKGGRPAPQPIDTGKLCFTQDWRNCTWYSELYTACECDSMDWIGCGEQSIDIPCQA